MFELCVVDGIGYENFIHDSERLLGIVPQKYKKIQYKNPNNHSGILLK